MTTTGRTKAISSTIRTKITTTSSNKDTTRTCVNNLLLSDFEIVLILGDSLMEQYIFMKLVFLQVMSKC